jgi:hypothetical protein
MIAAPPPVPADTIALINANAAPLPGFARGGVTAIAYNQIQYNGVNIQAADVPPPAFLNIASKVVNKVATERNAGAAVPQGVVSVPAGAPVSVVSSEVAAVAAVTAASIVPGAIIATVVAAAPANTAVQVAVTAASIVPGATVASVVAAAEGVVNPRLPGPVPGAAAGAGTLQALLSNGDWGSAFIGLVQDIRTPIPITTASIDSIFEWKEDVSGTPALMNGYVQEIVNLLQLPAGIKLFRNIIIAHHCLPGLPKVKFTSENSNESKYEPFPYPASSVINLRWDAANNIHFSENFVLVVKCNTAVPNAAHPGRQLNFTDIVFPAWAVLAHELGHYLDELIALKKSMDFKASIVSMAIVNPTPDVCVVYTAAMTSITISNNNGIVSGPIDCYFQKEYEEVLRTIIQGPYSIAKDAFVESWSYGIFDELVNILPTASMLQGLLGGGSDYSDGIVIGEAVIGGMVAVPPIGGPGGVAVNAGPTEKSFVRFSHQDARDFDRILENLIREAVRSARPKIAADRVNFVVNAIVAAAGGRVDNVDRIILPAGAPPPIGVVNAVGGGLKVAQKRTRATNAINAAVAAMGEFKDLVATMLALIQIPDPAGGAPIPLSAANNNLPNF